MAECDQHSHRLASQSNILLKSEREFKSQSSVESKKVSKFSANGVGTQSICLPTPLKKESLKITENPFLEEINIAKSEKDLSMIKSEEKEKRESQLVNQILGIKNLREAQG